MTIPHCFPSLIDEPTTQSLIICGTGLSTPNAPTVDALKPALDKIAHDLGIVPKGDFYMVAEAVMHGLNSSGRSDSENRLWLAEELGILDDRGWFGETGLPLSGNTPRHRAIARFAVEDRLKAIVSLNWDTLLEAALDSVGLAEGITPPRPWRITARVSAIDDIHMPNLGPANILPVIKPHGCVRNIEQARRQFRLTKTTPNIIFKITHSELTKLPAGQTLIDKEVEGYVAKCPLIAVGWKATEGYLRDTVIKSAKSVPALHTKTDAFTLSSRSWYPNSKDKNTYHEDIAIAYSKTEIEAFAQVGNPGQPTLDCLFQWLQARYALNKLKSASPATHHAALQTLLHQLDQPVHGHFILRWVDGWLHTWVRLCWRAGVMQGTDPYTGQEVEPWDIPVMPRDVHVPLGTMTGNRRELKAAAKLLSVLGNDLDRFNFEKYPGGLWDTLTCCLYIPLPGWGGAAHPADLAALMPLIEALRGLGFVRDIYLVCLDTETAPPDIIYRNQLAAQVMRLMPLERFARSNALTWIELEALKGGTHGLAA